MDDIEQSQIWRHNIIEDLIILASPTEQLEYHEQAPVDMATEMTCTWFDHHYRLNEPAFISVFSDIEWKALLDFSAIFNEFTENFDYKNHPIIEELLERPDWQRVIEAAKIALVVFDEN